MPRFIRFLFANLCSLLFVFPISAQDLSNEVFDCIMDPAETVRVGSPVSGILDSVSVKRGDRVTHGQVIARLNSSVEKATVDLLKTRASSTASIDAQKARFDLAAKRYERTKKLLARKVASEKNMEEVEAELVASRSLLRRAELDRAVAGKELIRAKAVLGLREIRSPIDGIVVERHLTAGEYVSQDSPVISLVKLDPLYVETFLPVRYYKQVVVGATAPVRPAQPVSGSYEAAVIVVDRVFDAASGTFGVRLELANPGGLLPAGHRCQLVFKAAEGG